MTTASGKPQIIPSTQRVFEAVCELRAMDQIATRETVAELTGLKLGVVDDRLRALVNDDKLKRLIRGIYELVDQYPPARAISKTLLPGGFVKLEIGDELLTLTPQEDRALALLQAGAAAQVTAIETGRAHLFLATTLTAKVEAYGREIEDLRSTIKGGC